MASLAVLMKAKAKPSTSSKKADKKFTADLSGIVAAFLATQSKIVSAQVKKWYANKGVLAGLLRKSDEGDFIDNLDLSGTDTFFKGEFADFLQKVYGEAGRQAIEAIDAGDVVDVDQISENAVAYAESTAGELITQIDETTRELIRAQITAAVKDGLTTAELGGELTDSQAFSAVRADRIARTEVVNAHVAGNVESWKASGQVQQTQWITAEDELTCVICSGNDKQIRDFGAEYPSGDTAPTAHPNCRCDVSAVLDKQKQKADLSVLMRK